MQEEALLHVENLTVQFEIAKQPYTVIDHLSFSLYPGQTLALVGESGCGKTMTALALLGILPTPPALPPTGRVEFLGQNLLTLSQKEMSRLRGSRLAMIFQDPTSALNPVYSIGEQLSEVATLHLGLEGEEAEERAIKSLEEVGIAAPRKRLREYPHQLSGGMRQRVMIAMALMCEPAVLIADEPTTALDVTIQAQILDLIRHLQKEKKMALLLITHDMGVVAEMANEVIVMYAGQAIETGTCEEIFDTPAHPYTQGLFASQPAYQKHRRLLKTIKGTVPSLTNYPAGCRFHPRCPYAWSHCEKGEVGKFVIGASPKHSCRCWLHENSVESETIKQERHFPFLPTNQQ